MVSSLPRLSRPVLIVFGVCLAGLTLALLIITSDVTLNLFAHFYLRLHLKPLTLSLQVIFFVAVVAAISYARATGPAHERSNRVLQLTPDRHVKRFKDKWTER